MSLQNLMTSLRDIEYEIMSKGGEYIDGYDELKTLVKEKATSVASFLATKRLDEEIERLKQFKKEADNEIKRLKGKKEYLEQVLHDYISKYGVIEVNIPDKKYAIPDLSVTREIIKEDIGNDAIWEFTVKVPEKYYLKLHMMLKEEGFDFTKKNITKVSDLPEDHPAIRKKIRPKIKFVKNLKKTK